MQEKDENYRIRIRNLISILFQSFKIEDGFNLLTTLPEELQLMVFEFVIGAKFSWDEFKNIKDSMIQETVSSSSDKLTSTIDKEKQLTQKNLDGKENSTFDSVAESSFFSCLSQKSTSKQSFDDTRKYNDNDISDYKKLMVEYQLGGFKSFPGGKAHQFLLSCKFIDKNDENKEYSVAITDSVDTVGPSLPIEYFLDKSHQIRNPIAIVLSTIIIPILKDLDQNEDDVLQKQLKEYLPEADFDNEFRENIFTKLKETNFDKKHLQGIVKEAERQFQARDVFEELMPEMLQTDMCYAKIVFPYNKTNVHWLSAEIKITRNNHHYAVEVYVHDPYGCGQMTEENFDTIKETVEKRICAEDPEATVTCINKVSPYKGRQTAGDAISCGIITAEDMIKLIQCQSLNIEYPYEYGALDLRKKHCEAFISYSNDSITKDRFIQRFETAKQAIESQQQIPPIIIHQLKGFSGELSSGEKDQLVKLIFTINNQDLKDRIINAITDVDSYHAKDGSYLVLIKSTIEEMPILLRSQNIEIDETDIKAINHIYRILFNKYVAEDVIYNVGSMLIIKKSESTSVLQQREFDISTQARASRYSFHRSASQQSVDDLESKRSIISMKQA